MIPSTQPSWSLLHKLALDLTESLAARDRYQRLIEVVRAAIARCDAIALLSLAEGELRPLAVDGLVPQVLGMRFALARHPRLRTIVRATRPVRFASDSPLPAAFEGLVENAPDALDAPQVIQDGLGCPLIAGGKVIGVLTADSLTADAFAGLDPDFLAALGALAGAALHTARLIETVEALAERRGQVVEELTRSTTAQAGTSLLGVSPAMERVRQEIETVASTGFAVLILGETGVGKELAARALHASSRRRQAPFIQVNCAALPEGVIESELFGHVRGAFSGAVSNRLGKFELCDGGTLFLDEIGELPPTVQPKLLRALQDGEVQRVGSDRPLHVDVRLLAATNRNLAHEVAEGRFRADLYHRLNVFPLRIPPLRDRRPDVPILAGFFLERHRLQLGLGRVVLDRRASAMLEASHWPGNARELDHVLARSLLKAATRAPKGGLVEVTVADIDPDVAVVAPPVVDVDGTLAGRVATGQLPLQEAIDGFKRAAVERTLAESGGNWAEAARRLGMHRSNLHHMARRLGLLKRGS